jgi:hypothetical protein
LATGADGADAAAGGIGSAGSRRSVNHLESIALKMGVSKVVAAAAAGLSRIPSEWGMELT